MAPHCISKEVDHVMLNSDHAISSMPEYGNVAHAIEFPW